LPEVYNGVRSGAAETGGLAVRIDGGSVPLPEPEDAAGVDGELTSGESALVESVGSTATPEAVSPPERPDAGFGASVDGSGASVMRAGASGDGPLAVSVSTSGGSVGAGVTRDGAGASASFTPGWVSLALSREASLPGGGGIGVSATVGGWRDSLYAGVDGTVTDAAGRTRSAGASFAATVDRAARDLGPYEGADPSLDGTRAVELHRELGGAPAGVLGAIVGAIGLGGRLAASSARSVTYRTHLAPERAREVVHDGEGVLRFASDKLRALGLKDEALEVPDLSRPESLSVGDELVVRTSGSVTAGLGVHLAGVGAGAHATLRGELEVGARRLDEHHVELTLTPIDVRGLELAATAPWVAEAGIDRLEAVAVRQAFVFDLRRPEARVAYDAMLSGEPPGSVALRAEDLAAMEAGASIEELPAGVARSRLERATAKQRRVGGGLGWGPLHRLWGFTGLGAERLRSEGVRTATDGRLTLSAESRGTESRRHVLLSGTEGLGVTGTIRSRVELGADGSRAERFGGLDLEATFSDSRVRGLELNDEVIDEINDAFGTSIEPFVREGAKKETREVRVTRTLTAGDLAALARADAAAIARAAEGADAREEVLRDLVAGLARSPEAGGAARAEVVQRYVQVAGLGGMAALHGLLGGRAEDLRVGTTSTAYTAPVEQARELGLKYREPISADATNAELTKRWREVEKATSRVEEGLRQAVLDPVLADEARQSIEAELFAASRTLEALVSVDHLSADQRRTLHDRLDAGWTTAREYRIMAKLAVGLQEPGEGGR
jgi:hypothetical protein